MKESTRNTFLFISMCLMLLFTGRVTARAEDYGTCRVASVRSVSEIKGLPAGYTEHVSASYGDKNGRTFYFRFTLDADSWVYLTGNYSAYSHDGAGTRVDFYYDSALDSRAGGFGWGYWQYDSEFTGFLKKGTYYAAATTTKENYQENFSGNVNIIAAAIPAADIFDFHVKPASCRKSAGVSVMDVLGSYAKSVQWRRGAVSPANVDSSLYWKKRTTSGPEDAAVLYSDNGEYAFIVAANGRYSMMVEDMSGSRYSAVVKVTGIDDKKPAVSGIKNGRTYKKAVRIRFSDKQSGIKSALLNGRKISSGRKVSAPGSYKLIVADKAGNRVVIKFCIRK